MFARSRNLIAFAILAIVILPGGFSSAQPPPGGGGQLLTPNNNPTGPSHVDAAPWYYSVPPATTAIAWPASWQPTDGVQKILETQGYNSGGSKGWTVNRFDLPGDYRLDLYYAWANTVARPSTYNYGGTPLNAPGHGGAFIALGWVPAPGAQLPGDGIVHWLQFISTTDSPATVGTPTIEEGGYKWYIDNKNNPISPLYDVGANGPANQQGLRDTPQAPNGLITWNAYTFIATQDVSDPANKRMWVANTGVTWGFTDPPAEVQVQAVPGPNGLILAVVGAVVAVSARRWMRRRMDAKESPPSESHTPGD
jgi:hypothetical protein